MSSTDPRPPALDDPYVAMQQRPEFQELRHRLRVWVFPMTAVFLAWYLLYVVLSAWARDFMGTELIGHVNVAYVFGLLQFVSTFLIAWLYARFADRRIDPQAGALRAEMERELEGRP